MDLIMKQMPVVVSALNVGFLQTLKLFIVTLVGALPLGLVIAFGSMSHFKPLSWLARLTVWVIRGTPLMIQLLIIYYFPGLVLHNPIWGGGETGRFLAAAVSFIINYACYFSEIYRGGIQGVFQKTCSPRRPGLSALPGSARHSVPQRRKRFMHLHAASVNDFLFFF